LLLGAGWQAQPWGIGALLRLGAAITVGGLALGLVWWETRAATGATGSAGGVEPAAHVEAGAQQSGGDAHDRMA